MTISVQSIPALCLAAITLYMGICHLLFFMRRTQRRADLTFAVSCLAMGLYDVFCAGLYSAESTLEGALWQRAQLVAISAVGIGFVWFVSDYTRRVGAGVRWGLSVVYLAAAAVMCFDRGSLVLRLDTPAVKSFTLLGIPFRYNEVAFGPFPQIQSVVSALAFGYLFYVVVCFYADDRRRARRLVFALVMFFIGVANDSLVPLGVYTFPYLIEYAYMAIVTVMAFALSQEIAEASQTQALLAQLEQRFDAFFGNSAVGFGFTDCEGVLRLANPGLCKMFNADAAALQGTNIFDHFHPLDRAALKMMVQRIVAGETHAHRTDKRYQWPDGATYWGDVSISIVFGARRRREGLTWLIVGITERRRAVDSLRLLNERLEDKVRERTDKLIGTNRRLEDSLRRLREDEEAGKLVQFRLLPPRRLEIGGFAFSRYLVSSLYMSGDFVDYFRIDDNHAGFYAADVSGHGVSSAFVTVLLKSFMTHSLERFAGREDRLILDPAALLGRFNGELLQEDLEKHAAVFYGVIDSTTGRLTFAGAGQLPFPILLHDGPLERLQTRGTPLGLFDTSTYENSERVLPPSSTLALFSDGVLEILPKTGLLDKQAFLEELVKSTAGDVDEMVRRLGLDEAMAPPDDITLLTVHRIPAP